MLWLNAGILDPVQVVGRDARRWFQRGGLSGEKCGVGKLGLKEPLESGGKVEIYEEENKGHQISRARWRRRGARLNKIFVGRKLWRRTT